MVKVPMAPVMTPRRCLIVRPCAPKARVGWQCLYRAETIEPRRIARFEAGLRANITAIARRLTCPV